MKAVKLNGKERKYPIKIEKDLKNTEEVEKEKRKNAISNMNRKKMDKLGNDKDMV